MSDSQELIPAANLQPEPEPQSSLTDLVVNSLRNIQKKDVRNINIKVDPKTGAEQLEVNLTNGNTLIQNNFASGVSERSVIQAPQFSSIAERDNAARDLYKAGKTQVEIARILGCSQTTIHNALKKRV